MNSKTNDEDIYLALQALETAIFWFEDYISCLEGHTNNEKSITSCPFDRAEAFYSEFEGRMYAGLIIALRNLFDSDNKTVGSIIGISMRNKELSSDLKSLLTKLEAMRGNLIAHQNTKQLKKVIAKNGSDYVKKSFLSNIEILYLLRLFYAKCKSIIESESGFPVKEKGGFDEWFKTIERRIITTS